MKNAKKKAKESFNTSISKISTEALSPYKHIELIERVLDRMDQTTDIEQYEDLKKYSHKIQEKYVKKIQMFIQQKWILYDPKIYFQPYIIICALWAEYAKKLLDWLLDNKRLVYKWIVKHDGYSFYYKDTFFTVAFAVGS